MQRGHEVRGRPLVRAVRTWMLWGMLAVVAVGLGVLDQAAADDRRPLFDSIDWSDDGMVDRTEFAHNKMVVFYVRDGDRDGFLAYEETNLSRATFDAADADGDGRVSGLEFVTSELTDFEAVDSNGDGLISWDEFDAFSQRIGFRD